MTRPHALHHTVCLALLCCIGGPASASSTALSCNAQALDSVGYTRAIQSVRALPELAAWSRSHKFPVVYGESMDRQVFVHDHCYWSVSVYANRPERLELWQIFYVDVVGKRLLVHDSLSGAAISLQKWRAQGDKARLA